MGYSTEKRRGLLELVQEAKELVGGCLHPDGRPKTFAELEEECIDVGDLFTAELLREHVTERSPATSSVCCPSCG